MNIPYAYSDTDVCEYHLNQLKITAGDTLQKDCPAVFHVPFPYTNDFEVKIQNALSISNVVVILISELHKETVDFFKKFQHPKIKFFLCGTVKDYPAKNWMDWFIHTSNFYKENDLLDQLTPYVPKNKFFDLLLGQQRRHRDIIYNFITKNNYTDQMIMTYKNHSPIILPNQHDANWIWPNIELEVLESTMPWSIARVKYNEQIVSLSQVISTEIYNQTAYTVVAETRYNNEWSFYTEKIVKPILAERLFIVFSGQHYLRNLHNLGFKTFDGIIDESYDDIEDYDLRFKLACEQIQYLVNQPQKSILEQIRPITEHNKQVMLTTDWYGNFSRELRAVLLEHVN
jgi:hypothetical protein